MLAKAYLNDGGLGLLGAQYAEVRSIAACDNEW